MGGLNWLCFKQHTIFSLKEINHSANDLLEFGQAQGAGDDGEGGADTQVDKAVHTELAHAEGLGALPAVPGGSDSTPSDSTSRTILVLVLSMVVVVAVVVGCRV